VKLLPRDFTLVTVSPSRPAFDRHVLALQEIVAGAAGRWPSPAGHPGSRSAAPGGEPAPGAFRP
jgi:hypothetical protein